MIASSDIELFLPKYLSPENYKRLLQELDAFPNNIDKRMYTSSVESNVLYQGDGYNSFPYVDLREVLKISSFILWLACLLIFLAVRQVSRL